MRIGDIIHFKEVFPNEKMPNYKDVLNGIPSKMAIEYLCFMSSRLHMNPMSHSTQNLILKELISGLPTSTYNKLRTAVGKQMFTYGNFYMFDTYALLKLINQVIQNKNDNDKPVSEASPVEKEAIFLSILIANQEIIDEYKADLAGIDNNLERFCRIAWPNLTVSSGHRIRNDFEMLCYKSVTFIEYISDKDEIMKCFLAYFNIPNREDALKFVTNILAFYLLTGVNKEESFFHHAFDFDVETENPIVSKYVLNLDTYDKNKFNAQDFKTLRETPIIKIREKRYDIVSWNFLLEKLSTGLLFDLFYKTDLKTHYTDKNGRPHFDTFKSNIGFCYSEKIFQKIFSESIVKPTDFYYAGNPEVETESDSYLRRGNRIALIEYKDPLMVKNLDYEKIKAEIDRKLNTNGKGTHQLVSLLDKLSKDINTFEPHLAKKINVKKLVIYPIITISEALFTSPGFTQYLNKEFKKLIASKNYPFYVKPLIAIDLDFFLQTYDQFKLGNIEFFNCLELYYSNSIKNRRKAIMAKNLQDTVRQFNGFRENVSKIIPRNSIRKGTIGSLAKYALDKLKLPKN